MLLKDVHGEIQIKNSQMEQEVDIDDDDTLYLPEDFTNKEFLLDQS